jgi:virulence-associated protein VagC
LIFEILVNVSSQQVALETYRGLGLLTASPDSLPRLKTEPDDDSDFVDGRSHVLKYPGKIELDETGNRIFISDSGHHRIVVARPDSGDVEVVVGDGVRGFRDGDFKTARFSSPQVWR